MHAITPLLLCVCAILPAQESAQPFRINIIDEQTQRAVPLVELRTVNGITHYTDSNGIVAFHEPGLMNQDVFFHITSHGYEFPKDGFGIRGKALRVTAGGETTLKIRRVNIAERLYRVTGGGIYRDSVLVGAKPPIREPLLNAFAIGSDSVVNAVYNGKIHWFWGDTNRPAYPLGNFQVPGATSLLPSPAGKGAGIFSPLPLYSGGEGPGVRGGMLPVKHHAKSSDAEPPHPGPLPLSTGGEGERKGLDPDKGIDLTYYVDKKGFAKETMRMPGTGPTWMTSLIVLPDDAGKDRLYASYVKIKPPLTVYARGFAVWQNEEQQFKHLVDVDMKAPIFADGHAFKHDGHVYFAHPFPVTRVRASSKDFLNPNEYESYTCLNEDRQLDRDEQGKLRYAWRKNTPAIDAKEETQWLKAGTIKADEVRWRLQERTTGKLVMPHHGSVYWNEHRKRWIMIVAEIFGTSVLGEIWYAEAESPTGPWKQAVKIVTHDSYSFYNPKQHPMFDNGRYIYFEGTYTHTFSGNKEMTPRYDYNQLMYKLDLDDVRLHPKAATPVK